MKKEGQELEGKREKEEWWRKRDIIERGKERKRDRGRGRERKIFDSRHHHAYIRNWSPEGCLFREIKPTGVERNGMREREREEAKS